MILKNIAILFSFFFAFASTNAQNSAVLDEYIRSGLDNNLQLRQKQLDINRNIEAVRQAKALFYPSIQFNANYTRAAGGRKIDFPIGDLLNPVYSTLNQLLQTNSFPTLENESIQFLPDNFHETKVTFGLPIFNSDLRYNRQIRELQLQSASAQREAYAAELKYQIKSAYLQYLQALKAEDIWTDAQTVLVELKRFNESLVRNNVATRDVVSSAEYELVKVEEEIANLKAAQNSARAYFNFLLNRDLQAEVVIDTSLLSPTPTATIGISSRDSSLALALARRQEFKALQAGLAASETSVKLQEANLKLPDFYIGGETGFQGFGYKFDRNQAYILAQVGMKFDLFTGGMNKSKVQEARLQAQSLSLQYEETQKRIALQTTQAWNNLLAARQAHQTALIGVRAAESAFRIIDNKYKAQQALLLEFLQAQNRVTTARQQVILATVALRLREAELAWSIND